MKEFLLNILPFNNREEMPKLLYIIKKLLAFLLCLFGAGIIAEGIVIIAMMIAGKDPLNGDVFSNIVMEMIMYYGYSVVVALIIVYWKLVEKKTIAELGFTKNFGGYFIGCGVAVVLLGISAGIITLAGALKWNGLFASIDIPLILLYFGGFIFQGLYEEVLCRGILLQTLRRKLPLPLAIGISCLPFIILHLSSMQDGGVYTVLGIANLAAISVVFSLLTVRTNGIWAACGLHSLWNFALFNILGLNLSGNDEKVAAVFNITTPEDSIFNGGSYGIEASLITFLVLIIGIILLLICRRKQE